MSTIKRWIIVCFALSVVTLSQAQEHQPVDTIKANEFIARAATLLRSNETDKSIQSAREGLSVSKKNFYLGGEARSNQLLGEAYAKKKEYNESLKAYLSALKAFEILKQDNRVINTYAAIGTLYQQQQAYTQAIKYFEQALKKSGDGNSKIDELLLEDIAHSYIQLENYQQAIQYKTRLLNIYIEQKNTDNVIEAYKELSSLCELTRQYRQAQRYNTELASIYGKKNDLGGLSSTHNNLGFISKRNDDLKTAAEYFMKVVELVNEQPKNLSESDKAILYLNVGVAYTNLKQYTRAKENYTIALKIREHQKNETEIANTDNYLASNYYVSGNTSRALKTVNEAIKLAEANHAEEVLATSYKILSLIHDKDNNPTKAKVYLEKHQALKDKLAKEAKERKEKMLQRSLLIEKNEEEIRTLLADQEREALESERKENKLKLQDNEIKLKAKELAILKRDQELKAIEYKNQQLEKERTEQALTLAQQQLEAEKRSRELDMLAKAKELQEQKLKQKILEEEKQSKTIQLLESDKKLKDEQLKNSYWIFGLFVLVIGIIAVSLIQKRKANRLLQHQQNEIKEKNEALLQNMEELRAAQDILSEQNDQLEVQHQKITHSIRYAERIQRSVLPADSMMNKLFPEHFILYLPKDIVSGDFYWASQKDKRRILAVVDCTGHGVPGAFMSIVGSNTLNELVNEKNVTEPAQILNQLHEGIRHKLSQEESQNHDGMDIGICSLEKNDDGSFKMMFAAAKQTLFVMRNGELLELDGDRKSIGGANAGNARDFSTKELILQKGDILYFTTDGYIDQNSPDRVRFNKKRFRTLIEEAYQQPIQPQRKAFENTLASHQQGAEQRDDITVIGVKL
jgi:serine phosphatase RsbU (regulator of sigma subunit)/tetratricopeptide (TPR) repeat protein